MTRLSEYLLPTEKQPPADAEAISNKLMVRAGLVRQMGAGMWSWLPAGWRVHQRVVAIVREEMDAIGAQELLLPVLQPAELWRKTGRLEIDELFKLTDRKGAELVLALTHEEAVTFHVSQIVRSYRDLPLILYHFQVKERDEARPRAGVLRTREFIMKDSYSFDRDQAGMEERYELHVGAYDRIMDRTGLRYYRVEGDVGVMGGVGAHEYMAPCAAGEDEIVLGDGYAANVEVAKSDAAVERRGEAYVRDGQTLSIEPAIEIGNIFKLGTRYSEPLGARYLDEQGEEHPIWMASYGIGPARIVAAAVEQFADEHGISWPRALAPFAVHLVALGKPGTPEREAADKLYETLLEGGVEVLYDDRDAGPGEKFADAELLGCPLRLTVGRRTLESGEIEAQLRRGRETVPGPRLVGDEASAGAPGAERPVERRRLSPARLFGLDRSGPPPAATQSGSPLNPWTIPNAIGFFRLALIPVFLVVALSSSDGVGAWPAALFGVIGWGDYADGIAARVTRQYSRLGALMDPVTDRLLVVSGAVVCWRFDLLPRWALAVLAVRELAMVALGRYGLTRGVELRINWPGRLAVAPVMGSFFFAMVGLGKAGEVMLYVGLALALLATALYLQHGFDELRARAPA
jgi:prolyl-tRNA synthetase/phosphatidylglycerophosphate synthase